MCGLMKLWVRIIICAAARASGRRGIHAHYQGEERLGALATSALSAFKKRERNACVRLESVISGEEETGDDDAPLSGTVTPPAAVPQGNQLGPWGPSGGAAHASQCGDPFATASDDDDQNSITIHQENFERLMLAKYGSLGCRSCDTPMLVGSSPLVPRL